MQTYIRTVHDLADRKICNVPSYKWMLVNSQLDTWKNARNKHDVDNYYSDPDFGLCYVKNLYPARIKCFYELLRDVSLKNNVKTILLNCETIYSFCCGPGPEIAAFICFIRNELHRSSRQLDIVAIDKLNYWRDYVKEIENLDYYCNITFQNATINNRFLNTLSNDNDVCIMSYPQAVVFENIWPLLQQKFKFILVVDQGKHQLLNLVRRCGYITDEFESKGTKRYFYYTKPILNNVKSCGHTIKYQFESLSGLCYEPITKYCPRYHIINTQCYNKDNAKCLTKINVILNCGHAASLFCHEEIEKGRSKSFCNEIITKKCNRNLHNIQYKCSDIPKVCVGLFLKKLNCGHSIELNCNSNTIPLCKQIIITSCIRNHSNKIYCYQKYESIKCNNIISKIRNCGHEDKIVCYNYDNDMIKCLKNITISHPQCHHMITIKCHQNISYLNNNLMCHEKIIKKCNRNLHNLEYYCYEKLSVESKCEEICEITLNCKIHKVNKKCSEYYKNKLCKCIDTVNMICGHKLENIETYNDLLLKSIDKCDEICNYPRLCGHKCTNKCYECINSNIHNETCIEKCSKLLKCGHKCTRLCHIDPCNLCEFKCFKNKLYNWFCNGKKSFDLLYTSKWKKIDIKQINNLDIQKHCEIIINQMSKYLKYTYLKENNKAIWYTLTNLLNLYQNFDTKMNDSELKDYLLLLCKKLILSINMKNSKIVEHLKSINVYLDKLFKIKEMIHNDEFDLFENIDQVIEILNDFK